MRMRKRHNLAPRMEACSAYLIEDPAAMRGEWLAAFPEQNRLYVELGCGKGRFTVETAKAEPSALVLAIEKVPDAMVLAMERARDAGLTNVRFMDYDAANLAELFAPEEIDRLYLNFCDPWPKSRDAKFRLTSPGFLRLYADALPLGGQIHFKTDNGPLFDWSVEQFTAEGWALSELTCDLHRDGPVGIMTDYEAKFTAEGLKINRLVATRTADTKTTAAGPVPRLRNAALADARGGAEPGPALRLEEDTLPLCHAFFRALKQAPELFEDPADYTPYTYDPARVDAFFAARRAKPDRKDFAILLGEDVIGQLALKHIDPALASGELEICLVSDEVKNRNYGSRAVRMALGRAFGPLGLETVTANTLLHNTRSQRVLQKNGFRTTGQDGHFRFFRVTKEQFYKRFSRAEANKEG